MILLIQNNTELSLTTKPASPKLSVEVLYLTFPYLPFFWWILTALVRFYGQGGLPVFKFPFMPREEIFFRLFETSAENMVGSSRYRGRDETQEPAPMQLWCAWRQWAEVARVGKWRAYVVWRWQLVGCLGGWGRGYELWGYTERTVQIRKPHCGGAACQIPLKREPPKNQCSRLRVQL